MGRAHPSISAGSMNEDEVLRQRLIVKETTFKKCFKRFVSLRSAIANEDLELCKEIGRDLVKDIEFWDLALGKAAVVSECNAREVQEYATLLNQIGARSHTARMQRAGADGRGIDRTSAGRGGGSEAAAEC